MNLERALLAALMAEWNQQNQESFGGRLSRPVLGLTDAPGVLGRWVIAERRLELSRALVRERPWAVVREVLRHEMAHQYVHEVLRVTDQSAHGEAFRQLCAQLGVDAAAQGLPVVEASDPEQIRLLRKVQRLLALAESSNPHEAEAAMAMAHRLMRQHNLQTLASAGARPFTYRQLGEVRLRQPAHETILGGILAQHFFVEVIIVQAFAPALGEWGRAMEVSGTPENVDMADYAWHFLLRAAERAWAAHPELAGRHRARFFNGVMMGFRERLEEQARHCEQEEGLVWRGDPELREWYERRHPRIRRGRAVRYAADQAWASGREVGKEIVLHRGIASGGDGGDPTQRGRLLG